MDKLPSTKIREGSPTIFLRGENLEYYRNIEYLKEVTRQANALLDRSNAKYENILDDQKLGYKVRARSTSDSAKSLSPDMEGKCKKCGLAHGAANFCIVERIMDSEKQMEDSKRKSKLSKGSWKSITSISVDARSLQKQQPDLMEEGAGKKAPDTNILDNVNLLDKMTPGQVLDTYETLCGRYGASAGRKFLLANSLVNPPEMKIERWTTCSEDRPKRTFEPTEKPRYEDARKQCLKPPTPEYQPLCPDISPEVREKMEQQVHLIPPCEGRPLHDGGKKWREVFCKNPPKHNDASTTEGAWSEEIVLEGSFSDESCKCKNQLCTCGVDKVCTTPKVEKNCVLYTHEEDDGNNYLLTIRRRLLRQRESKRTETRLFSRQSVAPVANVRTRSEEFLHKATTEQYNTLKNCLAERLNGTDYDHEEFDKNVQKVVDMAGPVSAIHPRMWDHWLEQMKKQQKIEERDEVDTLPSDINTDQDNESMISHSTRVDYKPGIIKPSRIPYADDVYDLIDNLYDKITRKFEKGILKNSFKASRMAYWPTYGFFHRRINLMGYQSPLLYDLKALVKFPEYTRRLTPFRVRKLRKTKRLKTLVRGLIGKNRRRSRIRGMQMGKQYRKIDQSYKYTPEAGYKGFKTKERKMLDPKETDRFAQCNLVQDPLKGITMKTIHHDFRLMSRMFEDAANAKREDLMDRGMMERLSEFQKKVYSAQQLPGPFLTDSDTEDEGQPDSTYRSPTKEDLQLLQKANLNSRCTNVPTQMSNQNATCTEGMARTKLRGPEKSNSEDKLKDAEDPEQNTANSYGSPHKSISSTNVKGEIRKHTDKVRQGKTDSNPNQNLHIRSSVKSLTNLLPPLRSSNAKSMSSKEFEETISSLQSELSNLLSQPSHVQPGTSPVQTNESSKAKSSRKKRNLAVTKLPELKTPSRNTNSKNGVSKISDKPLPNIKHRESVENLKPGHLPEKLPRKLAKKKSTLNVRSDSKSLKLPLLVENRKLGSKQSKESLAKSRKTSSKLPQIKLTSIPKQCGVKAWR